MSPIEIPEPREEIEELLRECFLEAGKADLISIMPLSPKAFRVFAYIGTTINELPA
jgi:hypothetical protein